MNEDEHQQLAAQLRQPQGADGLKTAEFMNKNNMAMIVQTIDTLDLAHRHRILELGPGNGDHVTALMSRASGLAYPGLEISETMWTEAQQRTTGLDAVDFQLYDGKSIPFDDNIFDRIFTVNTIYFWFDTVTLLNEIHRVLKPSGRLAISYVQRSFMNKLPFSKYGFTIFDQDDIESVVEKTNFDAVEHLHRSDVVGRPDGERLDRDFSVAVLTKEPTD